MPLTRSVGRLLPWALAAAAVLAAAFLWLPLPGRWDPRAEEVAAERYAELERFSGARTHQEIEAALRLVDPTGTLAPYLRLTPDTLEIRRLASDPHPAARLHLRSSPASPASPIGDRIPARVALDAGHFGGAWAWPEIRHISVGGGPTVREGDLTWGTVRLVEQDLNAAGARTQLLRGPPPDRDFAPGPQGGFHPGVEIRFWLAENDPLQKARLTPLRWLVLRQEAQRFSRERPFDLFNRFELRRRAAAAEAFDAEVTLSFHYNGGANGVLVFVPGNFLPEELATASQRFWAWRRVVDGSAAPTLALARSVARAMMRELDLPALPVEKTPEARASWLPVIPAEGIYARNLAILRRAPGIALLLEGPSLDHPDEYPRMLRADFHLDGRPYPDRIRPYARAVLEALGVSPTIN